MCPPTFSFPSFTPLIRRASRRLVSAHRRQCSGTGSGSSKCRDSRHSCCCCCCTDAITVHGSTCRHCHQLTSSRPVPSGLREHLIKIIRNCIATALNESGMTEKPKEKKTPSHPPVVGRSANSSSRKSVNIKRSRDAFVFRLMSPDTVVDDVTNCVRDVLHGR